VAIALVVNLNRKTNDKAGSIANFKYKMIQKLQTDSLNSKQKINLLVNETTKFMDGSAHVRNGTRYLMVLLVLLVVTEVTFFFLLKRNSTRQEI
jgi:hypothetical protein